MSKIEIEKFQQLCSLSDSAMLWLLKHASLPVEISPERKLLIETTALHTKEIIRMIAQRRKNLPPATKRMIVEQIGTILCEELDLLIDEALRED